MRVLMCGGVRLSGRREEEKEEDHKKRDGGGGVSHSFYSIGILRGDKSKGVSTGRAKGGSAKESQDRN